MLRFDGYNVMHIPTHLLISVYAAIIIIITQSIFVYKVQFRLSRSGHKIKCDKVNITLEYNSKLSGFSVITSQLVWINKVVLIKSKSVIFYRLRPET